MDARFFTIAACALTLAGAAAAQPPKPADAPKVTQTTRPTPVVLASADEIVAASAAPNAAPGAPAKRPRAMRVTTCRCGDPQPQPQEQP